MHRRASENARVLSANFPCDVSVFNESCEREGGREREKLFSVPQFALYTDSQTVKKKLVAQSECNNNNNNRWDEQNPSTHP